MSLEYLLTSYYRRLSSKDNGQQLKKYLDPIYVICMRERKEDENLMVEAAFFVAMSNEAGETNYAEIVFLPINTLVTDMNELQG